MSKLKAQNVDIINLKVKDKIFLYIQDPNKSKACFGVEGGGRGGVTFCLVVENYVNKNIWSHILVTRKIM